MGKMKTKGQLPDDGSTNDGSLGIDSGATPEPDAANGVPEEMQSLDKIRDILFGQKTREFDSQLGDLAKRLQVEMERLRSELQREIEATRSLLESRAEELRGRLEAEERQRSESHREISDEIRRLGENLRERLERLDAKIDALSGTTDDAVARLDDQKVSRSVLAQALTHIAGVIDGTRDTPPSKG